jgi:monoterpene epsilon-lactone hydrolase
MTQSKPRPVTREHFLPDDPRYRFPDTISEQARPGFSVLHACYSAPTLIPRTVEEWNEQHAAIERMVMEVAPSAEQPASMLGGVPVIRLPATGSGPDQPVLIFAHGGGHIWLSARSSLATAKLMADATGYEVISVDYTVAPGGTWREQTTEVIAVYEALLAEGRAPARIGMFGDSAGGALAAGSILKMRDQGLALPGALVLISPWSDVTGRGDSYMTLAAFDPMLTFADLKIGADVYAAPADQRHPYVSPVYGDYSKPFPPTLIQGGTREIMLSDFVRHYQAIRAGGGEAVLDLYEGMTHGFYALAPNAPETRVLAGRAAQFWATYLGAKRAAG